MVTISRTNGYYLYAIASDVAGAPAVAYRVTVKEPQKAETCEPLQVETTWAGAGAVAGRK